MKMPPCPGSGSVFTPGDYQLGLRWWLGLPLLDNLPPDLPCPRCAAATCDPFGDHLMCCKINNFTARHGAVQDCLLDLLRLGQQPCEREQALEKENARRTLSERLRPADILIRNWTGGKDTAVDLTIVHPLQRSEVPWTSAKGKSFLRKKEEAKIEKYEQPCRTSCQ